MMDPNFDISGKDYCICNNKTDKTPMIQCCRCNSWYHQKCLKISRMDFKLLTSSCNFWLCPNCFSSLRPDTVTVSIQKNLTTSRIPCPFSPCRTFKDDKRLKTHLDKSHKNTPIPSQIDITTESLYEILISAKKNILTIRRIPKAARYQAADKMATLIDVCLATQTPAAFEDLLLFSYKCFQLPYGKTKKSITSVVKENISSFTLPTETRQKKKQKPINIAQKIVEKVGDYDIKGAVRLLSSDETLATFNQTTFLELEKKHPTPSRLLDFPDAYESEDPFLVTTENDVRKAINTFPAGSAPGLDGMRPQYLKDMISNSAGEAGDRVLTALTKLCNFLLSGQLPHELCPILYGASLCALTKKEGGVRPIAVGNTFRRLTARIACSSVRPILSNYFTPNQYGVSVRLGCETVIHKVRSFVHNSENDDKVLLKIDFRNAFNSVERDNILSEIRENVPELYPFMYQCYRNPSNLAFGDRHIPSTVGAQQGDPCGPMAFSLAVHPIVRSMESELNLWYLDDATLAGEADTVFDDFDRLISKAKDLGLEVNPSKCELFFISDKVDINTLMKFQSIAPSIKVVGKEELAVLGSPIFDEAFSSHVETKILLVQNLFDRAPGLNAHVAYTLVKNCLFVPKFTFLLRTTPFWKFPHVVEKLDLAMKASLENILNVHLNDSQWTLASLPIRRGGLGIRKIRDICLPAFLASVNGVHNLTSAQTPSQDESCTIYLQDEALENWKCQNGENVPPITTSQRFWDNISISRIEENNLIFTSEEDTARLKALQCIESGAWLHAIPSKNIGTLMDNQLFHTCIALRLGCHIYQKHTCECGAEVSERGTHGLSCPKSKGRISRHCELNRIIQRALASVHINSTLEPSGLNRDDGKRPDGATLVPWSKGQRLVWDVTCVDTLAPTYLPQTAKESSSAAEGACKRKHGKYQQLKSSNFIFKGLAFETLGPWCEEAKSFIDIIGLMLITETGDPKAKHYLYQRISLAIQRGNAASIRGTLPNSITMDEFHYL